MSGRVFIVTGGLRGLGRAMVLGLAAAGYRVLAVGHLADDVAHAEAETAGQYWRGNIAWKVGDIRNGAVCDDVIAEASHRFGRLDGLVNNAGLTFTYINPGAEFGKQTPRFWEIDDEIVQNVMDVNFVAASKMAKRAAPILIEQGWGRIVNVTTRLSTMDTPGTTPYGQSKAALEMASQVWAKELAGTGVTVNIVNPGAGAHTPGMSDSMRQASRDGKMGRFIEPDEMVAPLLWAVSEAAGQTTGMRYDAISWDASLEPEEAARRNGIPAGFRLQEGAGTSH